MDAYITGATIKQLRELRNLTQAELAKRLDVSSKAISKWETAKGLPDISLIEPLAAALSVSVLALMSGNAVINKNISANMLRTKFYVCPLCGNIIHSTGDAEVSCCGITLPSLEAEEAEGMHDIVMEQVEDERYLLLSHPMEKTHFISFAAYVTSDRIFLNKFYPEGSASCRFPLKGHGFLYIYCNRHGLFQKRI